LPCSLQWCVHAETINSGRHESVSSALAIPFLPLSLSVMLCLLPTHLAGVLSLHVRAGFGASQKTELYRTENAFFPPKPNQNRPTSASIKPKQHYTVQSVTKCLKFAEMKIIKQLKQAVLHLSDVGNVGQE